MAAPDDPKRGDGQAAAGQVGIARLCLQPATKNAGGTGFAKGAGKDTLT